MNDQRLQAWLFLVPACLVAMYVTAQIASGDYTLAVLFVVALLSVALIIRAAYPAYMAFAALCPFNFAYMPLGLTTYPIVLGLCIVGIAVREGLVRRLHNPGLKSYNLLVTIFFAIAALKYASDPAFPSSFTGTTADVSGFRAWFDYGLSMLTMLAMGKFVSSTDDMLVFMRSSLFLCIAFAVVLIALVPVTADSVTVLLRNAGISIISFGNGWRRFVVLPHFGFIMIVASLLPAIFQCPKFLRRLLMPFGTLCFFTGANRSSFACVCIAVSVILLLQRRRKALAVMIVGIAMVVIAVNFAFGRGLISADTPGVRTFGLFNKDIADESDGSSSEEWRLVRWRMAWEDIKQHYLLGVGYGGMQDYDVLYSRTGMITQQDTIDLSLAAGDIHNGYISGARGLGIPAMVIFVIFILLQFFRHFRHGIRHRDLDSEQFQLNTYSAAIVSYFGTAMMTGMDVQTPILWINFATVIIVQRLIERQSVAENKESGEGFASHPIATPPGRYSPVSAPRIPM